MEVAFRDLATPPVGAAKLCYPRFWALWNDGRPFFGIGAFLAEDPIGLALCSDPYDDAESKTVRLLSVAVAPGMRGCGIATTLLAKAAAHAERVGANRLYAQYSSRSASAPIVERLLVAGGWEAPSVRVHRIGGPCSSVARGLRDFAKPLGEMVRRGFSSRPWSEIGDDEERAIRALVEERTAPSEFSPFPAIERSDRDLSVVIRCREEIVGWILASHEKADAILYHTGWVRDPYARMGWLLGGVFDVVARQSERLGPASLSIYETLGANAAMAAFMRRRLHDYQTWDDKLLQTSRPITPRSAAVA